MKTIRVFSTMMLMLMSMALSAQQQAIPTSFNMDMDVRYVEPLVGQTCIESTNVLWSIEQEVFTITFEDKDLVYYELSRKEKRQLDDNLKLYDNYWGTINIDNNKYRLATHVYKDDKGQQYLVKFILSKELGVLKIQVTEWQTGIPAYTLVFGTKEKMPCVESRPIQLTGL